MEKVLKLMQVLNAGEIKGKERMKVHSAYL